MEKTITKCPICHSPGEFRLDNTGIYNTICRLCGDFLFTWELSRALTAQDPEWHKVSGFIRNVSDRKTSRPLITLELFDEWKNRKDYPQTVDEQLDHFILYLGDLTRRLGLQIHLNEYAYPIIFGQDHREFQLIAHHLKDDLKLIYFDSGATATLSGLPYRLTVEGWKKYQTLKERHHFRQGFIAMAIGEDDDKSRYQIIHEAFKETLYEPLLISEKHHNNDIPEEIFAEIKRSRFLIADLTKLKPNVMFEAGFARGLGKDVIYICEMKWFERTIKSCFDISHRYIISFNESEPGSLTEPLKRRIELTIS
jgi:hypothetical protein